MSKLPACTKRVNLMRLVPIPDPFRARQLAAGQPADPDELPPPCPACGSETLWFIDRRTGAAQLVCVECTPHTPDAQDAPEAA